VLAAAILAAAAGCGSSATSTAPSSSPASDGPTGSFALALGLDLEDPESVAPLAGYDIAVLDGEGASAATIADLQDGGTTVLAYLSAGTVEPGRPWFAAAEDEPWLLDHWDDWDEWYADVSEPGMRSLIADAAEEELAKGFDGLFLDNTDMVQAHPDQRPGMIELVAALDAAAGPDRVIWAQNGDPIAAGIADHLDGWSHEDVSWTYDFDTEAYVRVSDDDHEAAIAMLTILSERGLEVTATDYTDGTDDGAAREAASAACDAGAIPFVSDIGLTRIPDPAERC
jgi:uncharacterized protein (TIGR01370 family)